MRRRRRWRRKREWGDKKGGRKVRSDNKSTRRSVVRCSKGRLGEQGGERKIGGETDEDEWIQERENREENEGNEGKRKPFSNFMRLETPRGAQKGTLR